MSGVKFKVYHDHGGYVDLLAGIGVFIGSVTVDSFFNSWRIPDEYLSQRQNIAPVATITSNYPESVGGRYPAPLNIRVSGDKVIWDFESSYSTHVATTINVFMRY
ncbi:hypothetical protein [Xenorhabdus indica]|uniref:hypothetical protein n=1 Tax=Xenorhabdus indica TaxID=333964 RepID=UPI001657238D|nr:hypothetical protein [Xenorhabdus indica]MBC8946979.1 hypothetical protein [Xenorhabdus indica]